MVRTWLAMTFKDKAVARKGLELNVGRFLGVFYTNNVIIGSWESEWIQNAFNIIIGLFRQYRPVANVTNLQAITCQPGALHSAMSEEAVGWRCTGVGESYRERIQRQVP